MQELSPQTHNTFLQTRFFESLDGLRAASIVGVVWFHTWYGTPQYEYLQQFPILRDGAFGVDVFFAISGFLITSLLVREGAARGKISLRNFYLRRALRIWPLYYAMLSVYIVLVLIVEGHSERGRTFFHYLPSYLTYTYTWFGPSTGQEAAIFNFAWSLSTEEQFYLLWPVVLAFLPRRGATASVAVLIAVHLVAVFGLLQPAFPAGSLGDRIAMSIAIPICFGAILALGLQSPRSFSMLYSALGKKWSAPTCALLLAACLLVPWSNGRLIAAFAVVALVGSVVIREDNGLSRLLRLKPVAYIGTVSYGMYMLNTLVIKATRPGLERVGITHPLAMFPLTLLVTIFVANLSYRFFETPFLRLKSRFATIRNRPA